MGGEKSLEGLAGLVQFLEVPPGRGPRVDPRGGHGFRMAEDGTGGE